MCEHTKKHNAVENKKNVCPSSVAGKKRFISGKMLFVFSSARKKRFHLAGDVRGGLEQPPPLPQTVQPPPPPGILQSPLPPSPALVVPAGYVPSDVVKDLLDQVSTLQMRVAHLEKVSCGSSTGSWSVEDGVKASDLEGATVTRCNSAGSFIMEIPAKEEGGIAENLDMDLEW